MPPPPHTPPRRAERAQRRPLPFQAGFSDKATADALEEKLKSSGCALEFYRYPTQVSSLPPGESLPQVGLWPDQTE